MLSGEHSADQNAAAQLQGLRVTLEQTQSVAGRLQGPPDALSYSRLSSRTRMRLLNCRDCSKFSSGRLAVQRDADRVGLGQV